MPASEIRGLSVSINRLVIRPFLMNLQAQSNAKLKCTKFKIKIMVSIEGVECMC
jgi:hypothetical protein